MRLLVTGGAGFIGSNLIHHIIDAPEIETLVNLDCLTYAGHLENLASIAAHPKYIFEKIDLRDKLAVFERLRKHRITHVMHLAAESHVDRSIAGPGDFIHTNVIGTFHLLEACRELWLNSPLRLDSPRSEPLAQPGRGEGQGEVSNSNPRGSTGDSPVRFGVSPKPSHSLPSDLCPPTSTPGSSLPAPRSDVSVSASQHFSVSDCSLAPRFLHVSTDEVYGSLGPTGCFTEMTPYAPNSPYSASKAASDMLVRAYHHTYGLPVVTTNCSNNYGPYQFPEKLIPVVIQSVLARKPIPVYGDGLNVRDWLYVRDHVEALWLVLRKGADGETYNIGGHNEQPNLRVVELICDLVDELRPELGGDSRRLISFVKDRPGHDRRYAIDAGKIQRELGWQPAHTFEQGLRATVRWYLENQHWCEAVLGKSATRQTPIHSHPVSSTR